MALNCPYTHHNIFPVFITEIESDTSSDVELLEEEEPKDSLISEDYSLPPQEFDTESDIEVISEEEAMSVPPLYFSMDSDIEVIDKSNVESDIEVLEGEDQYQSYGAHHVFN